MTHALIEASYAADEHPHAPAGSPKGGQFTPTGGGGGKKPKGKAPRKPPTKPAAHHGHSGPRIPAGSIGFDGQRGTGYGMRGGDPRVHELQRQLNRLGVKDLHGRALTDDGKDGPKTTSAVKAAQRRLGMNPTGIITPAFIDRLKSLHALPAKKAPAHPATHKPAKAAPKKATAAASTPYGPKSEVEYADPGYQSDGTARYPLDSAEHCRAAWSYINMPKNAAKYTPQQLASIKAKIQAAGKKYGVEFSAGDRTAAAAEMKAVELARPGTWKLSSGEQTFTEDMLRDAARYAGRPGARPAPLKLGHIDARFDGEPALGWLNNLRVEDHDGPVLLADITGMPDWLAAAAPTAWPDRSVEGWLDYQEGEDQYEFVVDGLALLGVTPPGMSSIRSLRDLPQALGIAASSAPGATRVVARAPKEAPASADEEPTEEGAGLMDPAKIREALGLADDASDEEVRATFGVALPADEPAPEPVAASQQPQLFDNTTSAAKPRQAAQVAGTMLVEASAWDAAQTRIKELERHASKQRAEERDRVIASAVQEGKFAPARREHWVRLWDADPEGTRQVIDTLARNVVPVAASGYSDGGEGPDEFEAEFAHLFGAPAGKGGRR